MIIELKPSNTQSDRTPEASHTTVRIEVPHDDLNLEQVVETLIVPALLASGFHPKSIDSFFGDGEACECDDNGFSMDRMRVLVAAWKSVTKRIVNAALLDNSKDLSEAIEDYKNLKDIEA